MTLTVHLAIWPGTKDSASVVPVLVFLIFYFFRKEETNWLAFYLVFVSPFLCLLIYLTGVGFLCFPLPSAEGRLRSKKAE